MKGTYIHLTSSIAPPVIPINDFSLWATCLLLMIGEVGIHSTYCAVLNTQKQLLKINSFSIMLYNIPTLPTKHVIFTSGVCICFK